MTETLKSHFSAAPPTDNYMETLFHKYSEAGENATTESYKMFNNRWMPYAYAAFLGISINRREKLESPIKFDRFKFDVVFNQNRDFAYALIIAALSQCNEFSDIMDKNKIMGIISEYAKGGETFVLKMPLILLNDLFDVMKETIAPNYNLKPSNIKTKIIGVRPGEKITEYLLSNFDIDAMVISCLV